MGNNEIYLGAEIRALCTLDNFRLMSIRELIDLQVKIRANKQYLVRKPDCGDMEAEEIRFWHKALKDIDKAFRERGIVVRGITVKDAAVANAVKNMMEMVNGVQNLGREIIRDLSDAQLERLVDEILDDFATAPNYVKSLLRLVQKEQERRGR